VGGAVLNPPPLAPLAVIIADQTISVGAPAQLDGSASTAPYGEPLSYDWSLLEQPFGSSAQLSDPSAVNPYFIPDIEGGYLVQLVVCDGSLYSEPAVVNIVANPPGAGVDLAVSITDTPDPVVRQQPVTYTLHIDNQSDANATDVRLEASFLADVRGTPVAEPAELCSCTTDGRVSCALGQLIANGSAEVLVRATPKRQGTFGIEATVSADGEDPDPGDNTAVEQTLVTK
jgi:hypothetical protein